jgi:hypothetical protein
MMPSDLIDRDCDSVVLSHSLDKVRYFRNVLYDDDMRVRIVVGGGAVGKSIALSQAVRDVEMCGNSGNQVCLFNYADPTPRLLIKEPKNTGTAILVYFRLSVDSYVTALLEEYGEENCEVVIFERDPTLE